MCLQKLVPTLSIHVLQVLTAFGAFLPPPRCVLHPTLHTGVALPVRSLAFATLLGVLISSSCPLLGDIHGILPY